MDRKSEHKIEAIVLGNGPSLRGFDLRRLSRFDVFGMNAAYRYWYEIGWFPRYYACLDLVVGASHCRAITELILNSDQLGIRGFLLRQELLDRIGPPAAAAKVYNFDLLRNCFSALRPGPVTTGSHTCAWASILGYQNIYLLGIDADYVEQVPNAAHRGGSVLEITRSGPNPNYFFDAYQQKGDRFNLPNPRKDLHLRSWRNVAEKLISHAKVLNANPQSKVDAFAFVPFEDIEKGGTVPADAVKQTGSDTTPAGPKDDISVAWQAAWSPSASFAFKPENPGQYFKKEGMVLAYDGDWGPLSAGEQHACAMAVKLLHKVDGIIYLGFPWAAFFSQLKTSENAAGLIRDLCAAVTPLIEKYNYILTVCEHDHPLTYQRLFAEIGLTHLFWSHATRPQTDFPEYADIKMLPFPLLPPLHPHGMPSVPEEKKYLYCHADMASDPGEGDRFGKLIAEHLCGDTRGYIHAQDQRERTASLDDEALTPAERHLRQCNRAAMVQKILRQSIFSLCTCGSGPNSAHLWASVETGVIPVIFSDTYPPLGNPALWWAAAVLCSGQPEDIKALPDRLETLARNKDRLDRKRHALRQLKMLYGPDCFIYDIQKLILSLAGRSAHTGITEYQPSAQTTGSYTRLLGLAIEINRNTDVKRSLSNIFMLACTSRTLLDPTEFLARYRENPELRRAYAHALRSCTDDYATSMLNALKLNGLHLEN